MMVLKALILLGAALMVGNIYYYTMFMKASDQLFTRKPQLKKWRAVGLLLLLFFLVGYLVIMFYDTSTIMALVLFFGSVYVSVALQEMMDLTYAQRQIMDDAVDDAKDTEVKTGLYTLNGFSRHVTEELRAHPDHKYMVVQWDIDEFKVYNDINGYHRGDEILEGIGRESPQRIASGIVFGHLNADHFVVLAENSEEVASDIYASIKEMLQSLEGGRELAFHMGICAIDGPDDSIVSACDHALIALRTIKDQYQEPYAWYHSEMKDSILEERRLVAEMADALKDGQFKPWFQPQVDYSSGKITGAEALVRWQHPERGLVPPIQFIPLFEKNGFIVQLDHYIWEQVCIFQRDWMDEGHEAYPISINISRRDIFAGDVTSFIISLVEKYQIDPSLLHLEITESVYMASPEKLNEVVGVLQDYGFTVEMDDFGSGYSSLNTLKDMKVDTIKLDMKFLQQSENSDRSGRIISAMIRMADWLDVATLAEGVETKEQADFLKSMGCSHMQGYYFFRPMCADDYRELLGRPQVALKETQASRKYLEGALDFMDSSAQATLVFNSFTGNAMIADYHHGILELLRINDHLAKALEPLKDDYDLNNSDLLNMLEPDQRAVLVGALDKAVKEHEESQCVIRVVPVAGDKGPRWLSIRMRVISSRGSSAVLYFSVEDITIHWQLEELEAELEKIFENVPGGILTFEIDNSMRPHYQYISDHVFRLYHLDPDDYRERASRQGIDFGITPAMIEEMAGDSKHEVHYYEKLMRRSSDGTNFWLQLQMIMQEEHGGKKTVYSIIRDATAQYDMESQQYAMFKAMPGGFIRYSCDELEEVTFVSEGLLELLELTREEFSQRYHDRFSPMVYEEDRERVLGEIDDQIGDKGTWDTCKYRVLTKSGQLRWVYDAAYVTTDSNGRRWFNVVILDLSMQTDSDKWVSA